MKIVAYYTRLHLKKLLIMLESSNRSFKSQLSVSEMNVYSQGLVFCFFLWLSKYLSKKIETEIGKRIIYYPEEEKDDGVQVIN